MNKDFALPSPHFRSARYGPAMIARIVMVEAAAAGLKGRLLAATSRAEEAFGAALRAKRAAEGPGRRGGRARCRGRGAERRRVPVQGGG